MILSENHVITEPSWVIIDHLGNDEDYEKALDIYGSLSSYLKNYTELKKKVINGILLPRCAEPTRD